MYSQYFIAGLEDGFSKEGSIGAKSLLARLQRVGHRGSTDPGMIGGLMHHGMTKAEKAGLAQIGGGSHLSPELLEKMLIEAGKSKRIDPFKHGDMIGGASLGGGLAGAGAAGGAHALDALASGSGAVSGLGAEAAGAVSGGTLSSALANALAASSSVIGKPAAAALAGTGAVGLGVGAGLGAKRLATNIIRGQNIKSLIGKHQGAGKGLSTHDEDLFAALREGYQKVDPSLLGKAKRNKELIGGGLGASGLLGTGIAMNKGN